jgi:hypothetical protein
MTAPTNPAAPITPGEALLWSALINAGIGFAVGLIPLAIGFVKGNKKYGLLGLVCSIVGGAILGVLLAVPCAAIFTWLILRSSKNKTGDSQP